MARQAATAAVVASCNHEIEGERPIYEETSATLDAARQMVKTQGEAYRDAKAKHMESATASASGRITSLEADVARLREALRALRERTAEVHKFAAACDQNRVESMVKMRNQTQADAGARNAQVRSELDAKKKAREEAAAMTASGSDAQRAAEAAKWQRDEEQAKNDWIEQANDEKERAISEVAQAKRLREADAQHDSLVQKREQRRLEQAKSNAEASEAAAKQSAKAELDTLRQTMVVRESVASKAAVAAVRAAELDYAAKQAEDAQVREVELQPLRAAIEAAETARSAAESREAQLRKEYQDLKARHRGGIR